LNILLLSLGGGGGNILRSVKDLFRRDLAVTQRTDGRFAERLRRAVTTRFLDTNEFSLASVPREERLIIGERTTRGLGARHNPDVAAQALEESRTEVEALLSRYSVVVVIGTGGKGTGAGTMFPVVQMARDQRKLVIPIFVRPSFERHEVDKRRYDHALKVVERFDSAKIRLMEILNDQGYAESDPQPQSVVWERMNRPIARGLRGFVYVLSDLSQVDPSDLSTLFAGGGRLRMGFAEIDPSNAQEPSEEQVAEAVRTCWENSYYAFSKQVGTSLICIQGHWSNVVDARIKGHLAAMATAGVPDSPYTPLYARAVQVPKPWGVTALFAEDMGSHAPLEIDWGFERKPGRLISVRAHGSDIGQVSVDKPESGAPRIIEGAADPIPPAQTNTAVTPNEEPTQPVEATPSFATFWDFAVAVNRSERAALALACNGTPGGIPIDGEEVKKLMGTMWFRGVVPRLSDEWRQRVLDVLVSNVPIPNHLLKVDHRGVRLSELSYAQLSDVVKRTYLPDVARADVDLLMIVGRLWGGEAVRRFQFVALSQNVELSRFASLLQGLRS
jgi:cell division GTPase FtsZ